MNKYWKISLIFWPLAAVAIYWLSNSGPAIFLNPEGQKYVSQTIGFPFSRCYNGPFDVDMPSVLGGPTCTDLAPIINNFAINTGLALVIFIAVVIGMKVYSRSRPTSITG